MYCRHPLASWVPSALLLTTLSLSGCGAPHDPTIPVWGTVTVDGVPLEHGDIEFAGKENSGLRRGAMIVDGQYRTAPMQGLMPGTYTVRIFSSPAEDAGSTNPDVMPGDEELGPQASRDVIPPAYNMRSKLTVMVTEQGPNEFNYDIETQK